MWLMKPNSLDFTTNFTKNSYDQVNPFPIHDQNLTFSETWWGQHRPRLFQIRRCSAFAAVATVSWFTIHHSVMVETPGRFVRSEFPMAQLWSFEKDLHPELNILLPALEKKNNIHYHMLSPFIMVLLLTHPSNNSRPEGATMISRAKGHAGHPSVDAAIIQGEQGLHEFHFADSCRAIKKKKPKTQKRNWSDKSCDVEMTLIHHPHHPVQWPWWPLNHHENQHYNIDIYI